MPSRRLTIPLCDVGPMVAGITEVETKSSEEIMNLLHTGNQRRTQQATAANEVSSRYGNSCIMYI